MDLDETTDYMFHIKPDPVACKVYEENLRYFAARNVPMSCNRPISPRLKAKISRVQWENLKPKDYPALFRQVVLLMSLGHDKTQKDLKARAEMVKTGEYIFRRAKLSLSGVPKGQTSVFGLPDRSREAFTGTFYLVQYGGNVTDTGRPHNPCKPVRGNWPWDDPTGRMNIYVVNAAMNEVIKPLRTYNRGQQGEHMRLIDGKPYVEGILPDGTIRLFRVSLDKDVFLEQVCQFQFKRSQR